MRSEQISLRQDVINAEYKSVAISAVCGIVRANLIKEFARSQNTALVEAD